MRISDWSSDVCSSDLEAPAVLVIAGVAARVDAGVGTLHVHGAAAVLEVVAALLAHEAVVDAAEVAPRVRELMDEQRPGIQEAVAVDVFPLVGDGPRAGAVLADRVRGRTRSDERRVGKEGVSKG